MSGGRDALGRKEATDAALRQAVFRAARLLEERWDAPPGAGELARCAGLSVFHFHRVFRAVVGETISQHSLRLRVERAASLLKFSSWQLQEVALMCGFGSQAGFSRAFRKFYGMPPREFRERKTVVPFLRAPVRSCAERGKPGPNGPAPTARIETWPELRGVALRFYGPMARLHEPWKELLGWAADSGIDLERCRFLGLWFDDYGTASDSAFRYECLLVAPDLPVPPAPFLERVIPAGKVAVVTAHGKVEALDRTWRSFGHGWLPFSGFQPRLDFACDEYPADLMLSSTVVKAAAGLFGFTMNLCLPVQTERMRT